MATAQVSAEYAQEAAEFSAELEENGFACSFGKMGEPIAPGEPPGGYVELASLYVLPSEWKSDFSADVKTEDQMFFVAATADLDDCTHMRKSSGKVLTIECVKPFKPDDVTVIYSEIQVRA